MKKNGCIAKDNSPAQRYVDAGIFRARVVKGETAEQDPTQQKGETRAGRNTLGFFEYNKFVIDAE